MSSGFALLTFTAALCFMFDQCAHSCPLYFEVGNNTLNTDILSGFRDILLFLLSSGLG